MKSFKILSLMCFLSIIASTVASEQHEQPNLLKLAVAVFHRITAEVDPAAIKDKTPSEMLRICLAEYKKKQQEKQRELDREIVQLRERCGY